MESEKLELVKIELPQPVEIFTPDGIAPVLKAIKEEIRKFVPDMKSKDGRKDIKKMGTKIRKSSEYLDGLGKKLVKEWKDNSIKVDSVRKKMRDELEETRQDMLRPLVEFNQKEDKRIKGHEEGLDQLRALGDYIQNNKRLLSSEEIKSEMEKIEKIEIGSSWEEFEKDALEAKKNALDKSNEILTEKIEQEQKDAEIEKLREEKRVKDKKDRETRIAQEASEKAMKDAEEKAQLESEKVVKEKEELKRREEKAIKEKEEAEIRTKVAEENAEKEKERARKQKIEDDKNAIKEQEKAAQEAIEKEQERVKAEEKKKESERLRREADFEHRKEINHKVVEALMLKSDIGKSEAMRVLTAIYNGDVPNVKINY